MYRYIVDIRYKKYEDNEDPCTVHNMLTSLCPNVTQLEDNKERTEVLVEFETIKEADYFGLGLVELKNKLDPECNVSCYIVTGKWKV